MKYEDYRHDGKVYQVNIDGVGQFTAEVGEEVLRAPTREGILQKIRHAVRKATIKLALPASYPIGARRHSRYDRGEDDIATAVVDVVVTGIHQRNRDVLIRRLDNKKAETLDGWKGQLLKPLTAAQKTEYLALSKARVQSARAFDKFIEKYNYSVQDVESALAKAQTLAGLSDEVEEA